MFRQLSVRVAAQSWRMPPSRCFANSSVVLQPPEGSNPSPTTHKNTKDRVKGSCISYMPSSASFVDVTNQPACAPTFISFHCEDEVTQLGLPAAQTSDFGGKKDRTTVVYTQPPGAENTESQSTRRLLIGVGKRYTAARDDNALRPLVGSLPQQPLCVDDSNNPMHEQRQQARAAVRTAVSALRSLRAPVDKTTTTNATTATSTGTSTTTNSDSNNETAGQPRAVLDLVSLAQVTSLPVSVVAEEATNIAVLCNHKFDRHKSQATKKLPPIRQLSMFFDKEEQLDTITTHVNTAKAFAESTVFAREIGNERADTVTPLFMEQLATEIAKQHQLDIEVIAGVTALQDEGLNLLAAVGQAAVSPPRLVLLEHKGDPDHPDDKIALVGKGVTFDSGGLNLKPTNFIENMHMDMCGAAAVLSTLRACARLKVPRNIVCVLALAENAIDAQAYKPHAIISSLSGQTVEVGNTDAEGRLCLADAMTYVQQQHKPHTMIDVATLTGACVVALGEYGAGVFSNDEALSLELKRCGERRFERCWPLPIYPEHVEELDSEFADLNSTGQSRYGGASTAAGFLSKFVIAPTKWVHLDIAGPAMYSKQRGHMCQGATGFGAQLLLDFVSTTPKHQ